MCWESEAEEKGVAVADHIEASVKAGDKIRVIAQDEESFYGPHSFKLGEVVEFLRMDSDGKGVEAEDEDGYIQTLMPHEWELASTPTLDVRSSLKPGDKIRVIEKNTDSRYGVHHLEVGEEYEFKRMHSDGKGVVVVYEGLWGPHQVLEPNEWELVKEEVKAPEVKLAKVGDRLRIITEGGDTRYAHGFTLGEIVTVESVDKHNPSYYAASEESSYEFWVDIADVEPYQEPKAKASLKVGDTVRVTTQHKHEPRTQPEADKRRIGWHAFNVGDLAEVKSISANGDIAASVGGFYQSLFKDDYEPVTPSLQETLEKAGFEVSTTPEATGEEIKPAVRIGDKVKVLTDGSEERDMTPQYVGYHEYDSGDVVTVVDVLGSSEDAEGEIVVHRSDKPSWDTQILHSGDYELLEEEAVAVVSASRPLSETLLEPKKLQAVMGILMMIPLLTSVRQEDMDRLEASLIYLANNFKRFRESGHAVNEELKAYLAS